MIDLAAFVLGAALLYLGGDFLVRGASAVAERLGVRAVVTAATIVAFGASAPEFATTITAVSLGAPETALGVVSGATLASLLVLGLAALILAVPVRVPGLSRLAFVLMASAVLVWPWALSLLEQEPDSPWARLIPVAAMVATLGLLARDFVKAASAPGDDTPIPDAADIYTIERTPDRFGVVLLFLAGGLALLAAGSLLAVPAARSLAGNDHAAGFLLLGLAAVLPELGAGLAAALTGRAALIMPSVLGSAAVNAFGVGALLVALPPSMSLVTMADGLQIAFAVIALLVALSIQTLLPTLGRWGGLLLLLVYLAAAVVLPYR